MSEGQVDLLLAQRLRLREQLLTQRIAIAQRMDPPSPARKNSAWPRSMTMRLLVQNPQQLTQLTTAVSTQLLGPRMGKTISFLLALLSIAAANLPQNPPAPTRPTPPVRTTPS